MTQEMNPHAVLVILHEDHSGLETTTFLNLAKSFLFGARQQFMAKLFETKLKKHCQRLDAIQAFRVSPAYGGHDEWKPWKAIAEQIKEAESTAKLSAPDVIMLHY